MEVYESWERESISYFSKHLHNFVAFPYPIYIAYLLAFDMHFKLTSL